jgi:hypothetical protein
MEFLCLCYSELSPVWRNWQTQQTQNLPGITPREGSIPFTGTTFELAVNNPLFRWV